VPSANCRPRPRRARRRRPSPAHRRCRRLQAALGALEDALRPFAGLAPAELDARLDPVARARAHLALARATDAGFRLYLSARGTDPETHAWRRGRARLDEAARGVRRAAAARELEGGRGGGAPGAAAVALEAAAAPPGAAGGKRGADAGGGGGGGKRGRHGGAPPARDAALAFLTDALGEARRPDAR
jgi:hypothetical protein